MSILVLIAVLTLCLIIEGFFSGSEMALVSADKYKLALATDGGSRRALSALHMVKRPAKFFSTTLLGTNLGTVTGSVVVTLFIIGRFGEEYAPLAVLYWPFTLILGEIVPKSICQHYADRLVLKVSPILFAVSTVLYPIVWLLSKLTDSLLGGVVKKHGSSPPLSREELEVMLEVGRADTSDVKQAERTMISRIFDLADKKVKSIMTPLPDVVAVPIGSTRDEAERILEKYAFSRVPVFDGRVFNVVGMLSGTDLLFDSAGTSIKDLIKPAYYISEEMPLDELLVAMKRRGEPLAIAVDEYGAAAGVVTAEDLLEEIVGEIRDEHDETPSNFRRIGWHHYIVNGRMEIEEANNRLKLGIPEGEYATVAGYVIHMMERIPKAGEGFKCGRLGFTVVRASERAVSEIEVAQTLERDE